MKTCKKCGLSKPECDFYDRRGRRGKVSKQGACKACYIAGHYEWLRRVMGDCATSRGYERWSVEEDDYMVRHYRRDRTTAECARALHRSYKAVKMRADLIGISGPTDWRLESGIDLGAVA